ncbi:nuclear pore complex protein Nup98-Nup96 [Cryptococcus neoformans c8]|nr:nuclear pore complex protein Nup98-Nup96 [Cryptococcus neoformans var. grubii AD1-83a]OXG62983.1 nuclear pore complex protein Nup98-Nup96 [Cryptococcus neoformans var. grubii c8]OXG67490.1 nuclear pore complex protein Nup98-Nup96 [Cryptococcus neoformans var. grubii MW-RSA1955]OXG71321.1 nuclear pore complex protein Nup98-Nup96 [Cryptococcus neoformans var. grubii CHC193]OXH17283.1 nuclear pore complex protein Nup98-Nup96 [Cryptococcus neoformans var. grubii A5-35-17]OXH19139.1 nuclear pore
MFGGTSAWGQNNQNQQQQQGGGLFGGGGGGTFGQQNTGGFGQSGTTGGFGQPAQNTGGVFGGGATANTGFGGFGASNQQQQQPQQSNAFGAARPTFGASGSTFGQNTAGGGLFGSSNTANTGFGSNTSNTSGGGLFGAKPATATFGSGATSNLFGAKPSTGFGASTNTQEVLKGPAELQTYRTDIPPPPPPSTGTANPIYYPTWQADPSTNTALGKEGPPHLFHSITAMLPYRGCSWEELRALDYQQGRKEATPQQQNAFGASSSGGFGQPASTGFGQQPATTGFGAKPAGTGLFGSSSPATGFGSTSNTSTGFGTSNTNTGGGLFGQSQPQQGSSLFSQTNTNTGGGLFGQTQPQQNTGGGLFGSNNTNTTNPFGAQNTQQPQATSTFGGFGQGKPAFGSTGTTGFGTGSAGTSTFGQAGTGTTGFGGFGQTQPQQQQQQQQPATSGGLFGGGGFGANTQQQAPGTGLFGQSAQQQQPAATGFGASKPGGLFGSTTTPASTSTGFGGFGQTSNTSQPAGTGLFGSTNTNTNTTGGGLFGQTQPQQTNQQPATGGGLFGSTSTAPTTGGGLFGAKPATTTAPSTGLFGQTQQTQQPAQTGGGLFGNTASTTGGGLFGSTTNNSLGQLGQQNQQSGGGLFGAKPATGGGLFGGASTTGTGTGLFGQQPQQQQQQQQQPQTGTTGGLFGNLGQSQPASTGLLGSTTTQPAQQNTFGGGGLFSGLGQSAVQQPQQQQQQLQPSLTASIDQNPYGNNPLFAYSGQKLEIGSQSKKPALPPLTASSYRLTPSTNKSKINKLRGFASPLNVSQSPGRAGSPLSISSPGRSSLFNSPAAPDRYKGLSDTALTPNAFVPRPNIKKLSVTPNIGSSIGGSDQLESVLGKSALKTSTSSLKGTISTPQTPGTPLVFHPPVNGTPSRPEIADSSATRSTSAIASPRVAGSERAPKKGDYWCRPKLEKLEQMSKEDLSQLSGFTAGRRGFGEVSFLEPVDLTLAPLEDILGSIIVVDQSELSVYPDDYSQKPERGQGLNVPARIMLENVFTTDKATKDWVRDPEDPRFQKFVRRVKAIPDTEFISYTDDGTWTFRVEHFTTYGIADSDEDESIENRDLGRRGKDVVRDFSRSPSGTSAEDDDDEIFPPTKSIRDVETEHDSGFEEDQLSEESYMEDGLTEADESGEMEFPQASWDLPIKSQLGAEGMKNLRGMQDSFFGSSASMTRPGKDLALSKKREAEKGYESFFREAEEENVKLDERAIKRTSFGETQISLPKLRQPRKYARVTEEESVAKGAEGLRVDAGLALGRSFRCSWGPNGELVHLGKICSPTESIRADTDAVVYIEKVDVLSEEPKVETSKSQRLLSLHLETSLIEQVEGMPTVTINPGIRFRDFASRFDAGDRSHEANVFRLGVALFDEIDIQLPEGSSEELIERISSIRRKLALSKWLEDAVAPLVDSDLITRSEDQPGKIFSLLSGHQVEHAVESALKAGNMRLATLLSQAGGEESFKDELLKQLEDWQAYKVNPLIAVGYRKLYALLAGITDVSAGDPSRGSDGCPDVLIADDLDWKRAFGLHLWYGIPFENTIRDVVDSYTFSLSSTHPPARPLPPYLEKPSDNIRSWNLPTEPTDVLYNLLQLYSDDAISLDQVLRSRDTSPSPFDVRLAWHLYVLLSRVLRRRDFEDRDESTGYSANADRLTAGYAAQLEEIGEWKWAAFVLLHLETVDGRSKALHALLYRHPAATKEDQAFLTETLCIPEEWIYESRAAFLCSTGDAWAEYHALLQAKLYDRAHKILVEKLAPEAVLRDDKTLLRRLCLKLEGKGVSGWEYGGKLFLEWADISEDTARPLASPLGFLRRRNISVY